MSQPIPHNGVGVLGLGSGRVPVAERPFPPGFARLSVMPRMNPDERFKKPVKIDEGRNGRRRNETDTNGSY
jgi:hypothetical protein